MLFLISAGNVIKGYTFSLTILVFYVSLSERRIFSSAACLLHYKKEKKYAHTKHENRWYYRYNPRIILYLKIVL